ncbi:MAG TPA: iron transporter [Candidatus Paceibacterota bacterium]|nr:iron transporter [Candidatus Paceibacterota bacterium]
MEDLKRSEETNNNDTKQQLAYAQGRAFGDALRHMTEEEATGAELASGDYLIGYAVERAEGMYAYDGEELVWLNPTDENAHIEVSVRSARDGRMLPGLTVTVTVEDQDGSEVGSEIHPFLWHPWLYHYGRNWTIPSEGEYRVRVHVTAPLTMMRHDREHGAAFSEDAEVVFEGVQLPVGQKLS